MNLLKTLKRKMSFSGFKPHFETFFKAGRPKPEVGSRKLMFAANAPVCYFHDFWQIANYLEKRVQGD